MATNSFFQVATWAERGFNAAGCIPFVALASGAIGVIAGKVEFLAGVVLGVMGAVCSLAPNNHDWSVPMTVMGIECAVHGIANIIRRMAEATFCFMTLGMGSPLLLIPNGYLGFNPVFLEYGMVTEFLTGQRDPATARLF